jgi:hypothetical protein
MKHVQWEGPRVWRAGSVIQVAIVAGGLAAGAIAVGLAAPSDHLQRRDHVLVLMD